MTVGAMQGLMAVEDYDLGLFAYRAGGDALGWMPRPRSMQVAYPLNDVPSLIFEYGKDQPGARWIINQTAGLEIAVKVWVASKSQWIEPPNSRFVVLQWEDDVTDDSNTMRFTCPGYAWLLSKHLILKGQQDDALNKMESDSKAEYDRVKGQHGGAVSTMNGSISTVKSAMKYKGGGYALHYFPKTVKSGSKQVKPKNKSVLYHTGRQQFYWYKASESKWYRITNKKATDQIPSAKAAATRRNDLSSMEAGAKKGYERAKYNAREATKNGKRPMVSTTAGWAIKRHWEESQMRGGLRLKGMGRSFNGVHGTGYNSAGKLHKKWPTRFDIDLTIGMSILDVLKQLTDMGVCEWQMRGRTLDMYRPGDYAKDVSSVVGLHMGRHLTEAPDKASRHDFANYWVVRGEGNLSFGMKPTKNVDAMLGWGTWETSLSVSGATKAAEAKKLAVNEAKNTLKRVKIESTRGLIVTTQGPRPMVDYLPGHKIRVYGVDGTMQKVRVMQVTLTREPDGHVSGNLVLADRFYAAALNFKASLSATLGGHEKSIGGGTVPMLPQPKAPVREKAKAAPASMAASARAGINESTGLGQTILSLAWSPAGEDAFEPLLPEEEPGDETDPGEDEPDY